MRGGAESDDAGESRASGACRGTRGSCTGSAIRDCEKAKKGKEKSERGEQESWTTWSSFLGRKKKNSRLLLFLECFRFRASDEAPILIHERDANTGLSRSCPLAAAMAQFDDSAARIRCSKGRRRWQCSSSFCQRTRPLSTSSATSSRSSANRDPRRQARTESLRRDPVQDEPRQGRESHASR